MGKFAQVPVEAFMDRRLSGRDLRVLGLLYVHADKNGVCWPSRGKLANLSGLPVKRISETTTRLVRFGWLTKQGKGGRSTACRYTLHIPLELCEQANNQNDDAYETLPKPVTVTETGMVNNPLPSPKLGGFIEGTVPILGTQSVPESGRGIEQTMEKTNTPPLPHTGRQIVSGGCGLIFPKQLSRKEADSAEQMLGAIPQDQQQAVLDVLAASIEAGSIRKSALACLGGLIRRFKAGSFDPTPGLHIAERREKQVQQLNKTKPPSTDEVLRQHAKLRGIPETDYLKQLGRH